MKLNYKKFGSGQPIVILHGLFGSLDNWQTLAKILGERYEVYTLDQRNHGQSPHSEEWNYDVMAEDLLQFFVDNKLKKVVLVGHSMGGKTAMKFALDNPELLSKLVIADIAPKTYAPHHNEVLIGLNAVDLEKVESRQQVEEIISRYIHEAGVRQFLMKNLYWKDLENKKLGWRFNLDVITQNIDIIGEGLEETNKQTETPTLFIRGAKSDYILDEDITLIRKLFPNSELETIPEAGHWLHAEAPKEFIEKTIAFIEK